VLNPNQKQWSVYYGPRADECVGELFVTEEVLEQYSEPKITIQDVRGDSRLNQDGTITHFNPDGTPVTPVMTTSVSIPEPSLLDWIGGIGDKLFGRRPQQTNHPTKRQQRVGSPTNYMGNNPNRAQHTTRPQPSSDTHRPQSVQQSMPKITVQEIVKPKITILPKNRQSKTMRMVQADVFVVSANNPSYPQRQNTEGLQIIEQNIIEVVDSIIRSNENTSLTLNNPVNAHITLNNDLTLKVSPCEAKSNATVQISTQPFEIAFPQERIGPQVRVGAELMRRQLSEPSYLLFISKTLEGIRVSAFQIKK
jgi:hypothetical protein